MSEATKIKWQLRVAMGMIYLSCTSIFTLTAMGQVEYMTPDTLKAVATMPATSLLACVTILALLLCGYLIRLLFGKLLNALDSNTKAISEMAQQLAARPCIRSRDND